MLSLEEFIRMDRLRDPDDMDALLETADLTRELIREARYSHMGTLIDYLVRNNYMEAFTWVMALLQDEFGKKEGCSLDDFSCEIGASLADFDALTGALAVDLRALKNDVEKVCDENGEVRAFCNIFTYKTGYENIYLISSESFDTKDNDYILYRLLFAGDPPS